MTGQFTLDAELVCKLLVWRQVGWRQVGVLLPKS